jgi:hypothetical protein
MVFLGFVEHRVRLFFLACLVKRRYCNCEFKDGGFLRQICSTSLFHLDDLDISIAVPVTYGSTRAKIEGV